MYKMLKIHKTDYFRLILRNYTNVNQFFKGDNP